MSAVGGNPAAVGHRGARTPSVALARAWGSGPADGAAAAAAAVAVHVAARRDRVQSAPAAEARRCPARARAHASTRPCDIRREGGSSLVVLDGERDIPL